MRRIPQRASGSRVSHERWLVSYADFMTLLFAFFATMYTVSSVDASKLSSVAKSLQAALLDSEQARAAQAAEIREHELKATATASTSDDGIQAQMTEALAAELANERITMSVDRRGVTVSIPEAGTFAIGRDELSESAQALVTRVAATLSQFPHAVRVEGHTDDVPIHNTRFASNWDLSTARASRVVELLIARGIGPERLSATGYGEFHPRVPNRSEQARAANRRIDLVILNAATSRTEEPAAAGVTQ
jgi:chemotaxis protein MotB